MEEDKKDIKKRKVIKNTLIIILTICLAWFFLTAINYYLVKKDQRPIFCFNYTKENENNDEYSLVCYGILYKYKEYYNIKDDKLNARELTLFFRDFTRSNEI